MSKITKDMIKRGYKQGLVKLVIEPNMESEVVCQIGDNWFYFGGITAEEKTVEEYKKVIPEETIISEIYETLDGFRDEFDDEYMYYYYYLLENLMSSDIKLKAYELYKLNWLAKHGYTLDDVLRKAYEIMISDYLDIQVEDDLLDAFEEIGFNGEMYVSFDEFIDNEYQDIEYMKMLFGGVDTKEYNDYCNDD